MAKLGYSSSREVNGSVVKVPVRWIQTAANVWHAANAPGTTPLVVDGVWGPNTQARTIAMISALRPASLSTLRPSEDRRYVYIDTALEQRLISLEVGSREVPAAPAPSAFPSGTPLVVAPPAELEVVEEGTPAWVYALGVGSFLAALGVVYATINLSPSR